MKILSRAYRLINRLRNKVGRVAVNIENKLHSLRKIPESMRGSVHIDTWQEELYSATIRQVQILWWLLLHLVIQSQLDDPEVARLVTIMVGSLVARAIKSGLARMRQLWPRSATAMNESRNERLTHRTTVLKIHVRERFGREKNEERPLESRRGQTECKHVIILILEKSTNEKIS